MILKCKKSKRIFLKIEKRFSSELVKEIKSILDCCESNFVMGFVRCREGSNESDLPDNHIGCYFIDEHENGGLSGDSYSGYGYIKVSKKDYLKFSYAM